MKNLRIKHSFKSETYGDRIGQSDALTLCQYEDEDGRPMAASLHGHLHIQIAERQILGMRKVAEQQPVYRK